MTKTRIIPLCKSNLTEIKEIIESDFDIIHQKNEYNYHLRTKKEIIREIKFKIINDEEFKKLDLVQREFLIKKGNNPVFIINSYTVLKKCINTDNDDDFITVLQSLLDDYEDITQIIEIED